MLIAIIVDNYGLIKNERASILFWTNRMDYVAEIDGTIGITLKLLGQKKVQNMVYVDESYAETWAKLEAVLTGKGPNNFFESLTYIMKYALAILIMFLWFLAGIPTFGVLWPPRIREILLANTSNERTRNAILVEINVQIDSLREELEELKVSSRYDRKNDRDQLISVREDADALQKSILEDMVQIRDLMKTLLELSRADAGLSSA